MPLCTYVVSYKGGNYVAQGRHSNFKGFVSTWASNIPADALPALTASLRKELASKAFGGEFSELPNLKLVWRKRLQVGTDELTVVAVQTQS